MTTATIGASIAMGFLHGFVAWRLMFRLVGPVARLSQGRRVLTLRITGAVTYVVVLTFLIGVTFLLLEAFGLSVTGTPTRESRGYLFIGSLIGFFLSGLLPKIEVGLQRRRERHRADSPGKDDK